MTPETTCVLIAGGGPVGLSAALELRSRGVPAIVVTDNIDTARHPKCNLTNARSMEHFRRLGLSSNLRAAGLPPGLPRESAYVTRFCGYEFGRLPRPLIQWPTAEPPNFISQIRFEEQLRAAAESRGVDLRFGWKLVSFAETGDHVEGIVANVETGESRSIRSDFLLAADGASSTVRRILDIRLRGEGGDKDRAFMGGTMLSFYIEAPTLLEESRRRPAQMTWIINRAMRAMMYAQDANLRWVVHFQVPPGVAWEQVDGEATIRALLGADVRFRIISGGPWRGGLALVAEQYRRGRIFLAGDAAHLFTPLGGFGMNTGIGDVMNLCWKIGAVRAGWGGEALLDSYETERRAIGLRNSQIGVRCAQIMDDWIVPDELESEGPAGEGARAAFGEQVVREDRVQYHTVGLQLGERYQSPIIIQDGAPAPPDDWDKVWPQAFPGARAPHLLVKGEPLQDHFGEGLTVLERGAPAYASAIAAEAKRLAIPLKIVSLDEDATGSYGRKLTLVRPDGHIAWHADDVLEPRRMLETISGQGGVRR